MTRAFHIYIFCWNATDWILFENFVSLKPWCARGETAASSFPDRWILTVCVKKIVWSTDMTTHHWWLQPDLSGVTTAFCFRLQSLCQCNRWHITYVSDLFGPLNCILRRTSFTLCLFWNLVVLPFTECLKKGCLADYIWYKGLTSPFYYSKCPLPAVMQPLSSCLKSPWLPPQG